ncbi:MAG: acyl-CoA dehydratase activase, partial [Nitrospinota bacterium]
GGEFINAGGAALISSTFETKKPPVDLTSVLRDQPSGKSFYYPPLHEIHSPLPDFDSHLSEVKQAVEIDVYASITKRGRIECYAGFDIGSTSTKAALMTPDQEVLVGLYTRTGGQPITAIQRLTRTLEELESSYDATFNILASGTTGSGRKFIQKVVSADYAVDEITAHARAACFLNPEIDTIVEIGGQDAKFTVMKNGHVTFSVMNYVCAAGTGSFIEEQAKRLNVPLSEYSRLAEHAHAPLISNRCTVFMERDINHHLSLGYSKEELLAAALHSVRDNYLSKVAHKDKIGEHIAFQGATAKNPALVKAFEQTLKKPIYVSKYCHLTGALGVCLKMSECLNLKASQFRKKLHRETLDVQEYICEFCTNNCKIKTMRLEGETLGWGYLCGREERDEGYKKKKK